MRKTLAIMSVAIWPLGAQELDQKLEQKLAEAQQKMVEVQRKFADVNLDEQMEKVQANVAAQMLELRAKIPSLEGKLAQAGVSAEASAKAMMAMDMVKTLGADFALKSNFAFQMRGRGDGSYDSGMRSLDERKYDEAVQRFSVAVDQKASRADGALYWKAYAQNRLGNRDEALASIAALRKDYPQSRWLNDAQALEAEIRQSAGKPVSPADETNEDIKLMAINSLMNADPERAMPLLENLLKGSSSPKLKDRALFVLTQNKSPRSQEVLANYAKGAGNPDLQLRAVRYIGMSGTPESQQQLAAVYGASNDASIKREIIRSLASSRNKDQVFNLAKNEKDQEVRLEAIRQLGAMRAADQLVQLYAGETSADNKTQILRSLRAAGAGNRLLEIAKNEKDEKVRNDAVRELANSDTATSDSLLQMYASFSDMRSRRELVNGLHNRGDAKALVDLARKETDPEMKKYIVMRLGNMHGKEATDYMMELLK